MSHKNGYEGTSTVTSKTRQRAIFVFFFQMFRLGFSCLHLPVFFEFPRKLSSALAFPRPCTSVVNLIVLTALFAKHRVHEAKIAPNIEAPPLCTRNQMRYQSCVDPMSLLEVDLTGLDGWTPAISPPHYDCKNNCVFLPTVPEACMDLLIRFPVVSCRARAVHH
jgi:hypothetical protein